MEADFVIVGGGTAGCVLANRLSFDPAASVVVIEAGPEASSPWIGIPAGAAKLFAHPRLNWNYVTDPEAPLDGRTLHWPRGKVLGGTSSINGMTYVRGQREDYDAWSAQTRGEWSWQSVLPYFRRLEDSPFGAPELRGRGGPLRIGGIEERHPLAEAFLAAAVACGIPPNDDYNGARQEGVSFNQVAMRDGVRSSAASAYLAPARRRANLRIVTEALACRVALDKRRATGVEIERDGRREIVRARREVLVCAGTVASPQLLLLSGIGDAQALRALDIAVTAHLPAVGRNLQDHVRAQLVHRTRVRSLNDEARGPRLAWHALRYAMTRRGLLASTASQVNAFVRSSSQADRPDLQLVFRPSSGDYRHGRFVLHDHPGVMTMVGLLRPRSRGRVTLRTNDPHAPPSIVTGHLSDASDFEPLVRGIGIVRRIFATPPIAGLVAEELRPGPSIVDDDALRDHLRRTAESLYHAVGTCAMGTGPETSVVDPSLRVHGVDGLCVVDASVMPSTPSGNTAAPVIMIAERAADIVRGRRQ